MSEEQVQETSASDKPIFTQQEWQLRSQIETELRPKLRIEYETLFSLWKTEELDKVRKESEKIATEGIQKLFEQWKEEQKPPSDDDIQKLLSQEYVDFNLPVTYYDESENTPKSIAFTIRELPQASEKKFYKQFKDKILDKTSALQAFTQAGMDKPFEERAKAFLELFDESFDMLAEAVVICLNPFGRNQMITKAWVQNNISSNRQWTIVDAQIKVNRLKDFFSKLSQSGQSTQTMLGGLNFQQLQQLAR
jgi:hypothetical protein